ncbi:lytic murein transglycosylase [Rhodohalobacter sp. 8-1]|uniref:lytic murein transglycosylase n=1 Tax=Rhodohalobacter sp. 8-1 TaxID=3131972 RepID=UPI0030EE791A
MYKTISSLVLTSLILFITVLPAAAETDPEKNEKYEERLNALKEYFQSNGMSIDQMLEDSRFEIYESIGDRFKNSAERKTLNLEDYKVILGFEAKKSQMVTFIKEHNQQLEIAEIEYGIPKYVIAAIIGIESDYGRNIGSYNPFNSYVSMYAVDYRADFARAQLKELIEFITRKEIDVFELKSSYAGAMSFAQFIPYSINKWWVGDDIFDMNNNIMSVGNYLAYFKERTGSIDRAVFRYNPSELYTSAVMALANEAQQM